MSTPANGAPITASERGSYPEQPNGASAPGPKEQPTMTTEKAVFLTAKKSQERPAPLSLRAKSPSAHLKRVMTKFQCRTYSVAKT
jgi:hypothetical protein